jgi:hypothetical protein
MAGFNLLKMGEVIFRCKECNDQKKPFHLIELQLVNRGDTVLLAFKGVCGHMKVIMYDVRDAESL